MNKHDRRFAERTREALREGSAAAEESAHAMGNGYFAAAEAVRDFNMKLIEMAQNNMMATLTFAQKVATAKTPRKRLLFGPPALAIALRGGRINQRNWPHSRKGSCKCRAGKRNSVALVHSNTARSGLSWPGFSFGEGGSAFDKPPAPRNARRAPATGY